MSYPEFDGIDEGFALVLGTIPGSAPEPYVAVGGQQLFPGLAAAVKYRANDGHACWMGERCITVGSTPKANIPVDAKRDGKNRFVTVSTSADQGASPDAVNMVAMRWQEISGEDYCPGPAVCYDDFDQQEYEAQFQPTWTRQYDRDGDQEDRATALVIDPVGRMVTVGYREVEDMDYDALAIHYHKQIVGQPNSQLNCGCRYFVKETAGRDIAYAGATQPWGNLILAGRTGSAAQSAVGWVAKYCWLIGDIDHNGVVDDTDLAIVLTYFGKNCAD